MYIEFKAGQKFAVANAETSESLDTFQDAGYLLKSDDVVIDIDCLPKDTIEKMIQIFDIKTQVVWTTRGAHLYYKKPENFNKGANRICCLGFPIEIKHDKNTKNGITIKQNGIERRIDNKGHFEELPPMFNKYKRFESLLGLQESDQRNNKLFKHRKQLEGVQGWEKMLRFINDFVFAEPLEEKEFQTICRDMPLDTSELKENDIRNLIKNENMVVKYGTDLWFYYKGEYHDDADVLRRLIYNKVPNVMAKFVDEVIKQLDYTVKKIDDDKVFDIKFSNGILRNGEFIGIDSMEFTPYTININYFEDAEPIEFVDDYINKLTDYDEDYRNLLLEVLGHCFITDKEFKRLLAKFFIFRGDGSNGKGTLLQVIKAILGANNCSAISIKQMSDPVRAVSMKGKLANLGDDIEASAIDYEQMKMLKNISTCDFISMRQLYKSSEDIQITASLIFTSNSDIKSFEKGEAYQRRVMWLPMFTKIQDKDKTPDFITKLTSRDSLEYWLRLIVEGYQRLYRNKKFTESKRVIDYNAKYHMENNIVELFLNDVGIDALLGKTMNEIKQMIGEWNDDGEKLPSNKLVKDTLWREYEVGFLLKKREGSVGRYLTYQKDTEKDIKP